MKKLRTVSCALVVLAALFMLPLTGCSNQGSAPANSNDNQNEQSASEQASEQTTQDTAVPNEEELVIKESGYTVDDGYVHYAVAIENPSTSSEPDYAHIIVTGTDDDGSIVFSDDWTISHLPCSTTTYWASQAGNGKVKKSTNIEIEVSTDSDAWQESNLTEAGMYTFGTPKFQKNDYGSGGEVTGTVELAKEPPTDEYLEPMIVVIFRDEKGAILTGGSGYIDHELKMGKKTAYEINCYHAPKFDTVEVYGNPW